MLAGGLVRFLSELADQFFEDGAYTGIADHLRVQVDSRKALGDQVQQPGLLELVDLGVELEAIENVLNGWGEGLDVGPQVFADVVLVPHQPLHVEW